VHARWIRLTSEINESIGSRCGSDCGLDSGSEEVLKVWMKKNSKGRKRMRRREAIFFFCCFFCVCLCFFQLRYNAFFVLWDFEIGFVWENGERGHVSESIVDLRSWTAFHCFQFRTSQIFF
jgi:hypothetical protein